MRTNRLALLGVVVATGCQGGAKSAEPPESTPPAESRIAESSIAVSTEDGWEVRSTIGASRAADPTAETVAVGASAPARISTPAVIARPMATGTSRPGSVAHAFTTPRPDAVQSAPLRAGTTDDNVNVAAFLAFVNDQFNSRSVGTWSRRIDIDGMLSIRVIDADGKPVPSAHLSLVDEKADRALWTATTYGDGTAPFYPRIAGVGEGTIAVQVRAGDLKTTVRLAQGDTTVPLPGKRAETALQLDVCFIIDTTGSMGDEIARVQESLLAVTERARSLGREFDLRYGAVLYKDVGDSYLTKSHPFTSDIAAFDRALRGISASGGGDTPESLNQGLHVAVNGMTWRDGAAKVAFLIADAPPHMDYPQDILYPATLRSAVAKGIRIHSVAASGLDADGTVVMRQIAQYTRGKFVFIEYGGSVAATAASHGVAGKVASNNLDAILYEQIRDEIAKWGRSATEAPTLTSGTVRTTVGDPVR